MMNEVIATFPREPSVDRDEEGPNRAAWDLFDHELAKIKEQADEHATIAIVFACAACELSINDAAARLLGDTYFAKHIDRLDLVSKWIIVPRLINGHRIDRGGRAHELLKRLVSARNDLMHPKSVPFSINQSRHQAKPPPRSRFELAADAINTLDVLADEAENFDHQLQGMNLRDHEEQIRRMIERATKT